MRKPTKPIRVFFSELSQRFYATRAYKIDEKGLVTVTGEKFDVTNDIGSIIEAYDITFHSKELETLMAEHLIDGEFQSDKYPTTPRGKVPLSCKDVTAQDLLWEYAQRRRAIDPEFSEDLETALRNAGFVSPRALTSSSR